MLGDVALYELALGDHLRAIGTHLVKCAFDQFGANALTAKFRRDFGVNKRDHPVTQFIVGRGYVPVGRKFVPMLASIVDDLGHSPSFPAYRRLLTKAVLQPSALVITGNDASGS